MSGGMGAIAMLLAWAALSVAAVPASAASEVHVQTSLELDGTGRLYASSPPGSLEWEACTRGECTAFGSGREVTTKGAKVGTVFRVRYDEAQIALSPEWQGPLKAGAPPRVTGAIQANGYVTPVRGSWSGGWRDEPSEMQLSACETEAGEGCVSLTDPHYMRQCAFSSSFYLDPQFVGRYLRVADRQDGGPHFEAAIGAITPYGAEVFAQSRNISVAVVGQIAPPATPAGGECGPPPPPIATISVEGIARVECGGGCSVALVGMRNGRRQLVSRSIPAQNLLRPSAAVELSLTRPALARLGVGRVRLVVEVDGNRLAQRAIRSGS